jgi:hypothetical protein
VWGTPLQATALVNEAYVRLVDGKAARARHYQKRGGHAAKVTFDEALVVTNEPATDFVALDDALEALAKFDKRKSRVIELRFFGGLSVEENSVRSESIACDRDGRLAACEGMAEARDARRKRA